MIKKIFKNPVYSCLIAAFCCALWGSAFPTIKIGYKLFEVASKDYATQILFAGMRFALAGVLVIILGSIASKRVLIPKKSSFGKIAVLALFQTILQYVFFYIGLAHTTGTKSSILDSTSVFFAFIISAIVFKQDKFTAKKIIGCLIGFAGTVIINLSGGGLNSDFAFIGEGFIILSAFAYACSSVFLKKFSNTDNPVTLSGYQFVLGGIVMMAVGFAFGGKLNTFSLKGVILLLYLGLISAVAYTLWGILLKYNDVSKIAVFCFMTPVFGCIFSALALGETVGQSFSRVVISLLLVSVGTVVVNSKKKINGN